MQVGLDELIRVVLESELGLESELLVEKHE
jgi:hypothetical protein